MTAPAIVDTRIVHSRTTPLRHRFTYRSASWLIDIDAPPRLPKLLAPLAQFVPADHFPQPPGSPRETLRRRLEDHLHSLGRRTPDGRILALTSPRVFGHVFNPISVFWCHHADGSTAMVIAEVHNTYGARHCYVVDTDEHGYAEVDKDFYVSPFNDVSGRYRLRCPEPTPDGHVSVSIVLEREGHGPFTAALTGVAHPADTATLLRTQLLRPLAPWLVSARIRRQGIALWARRLPIVPRQKDSHEL